MSKYLIRCIVVIVAGVVFVRCVENKNLRDTWINTPPRSPPKAGFSNATGTFRVSEFESATFIVCVKDGYPSSEFNDWRKTDHTDKGLLRIPAGSVSTWRSNNGEEICSVLHFENITRWHGTTYWGIATNGVGDPVVVNVTLDVEFPPSVYPVEEPIINVTPGSGLVLLNFSFEAPKHNCLVMLLHNGVVVPDSPRIGRSLFRDGPIGSLRVNLTELTKEEVCGLWELRVLSDLTGDWKAVHVNVPGGCDHTSSDSKNKQDGTRLAFVRSKSTQGTHISFKEHEPARLDCVFEASSRPTLMWLSREMTPVSGQETHNTSGYRTTRYWDKITRENQGQHLCVARLPGRDEVRKLFVVDVISDKFEPTITGDSVDYGDWRINDGPGSKRAHGTTELKFLFNMESPVHGVEYRCKFVAGSFSYYFCPAIEWDGYKARVTCALTPEDIAEWSSGSNVTVSFSVRHPTYGRRIAYHEFKPNEDHPSTSWSLWVVFAAVLLLVLVLGGAWLLLSKLRLFQFCGNRSSRPEQTELSAAYSISIWPSNLISTSTVALSQCLADNVEQSTARHSKKHGTEHL